MSRLFIGIPVDDACQQQLDAATAPFPRSLKWTPRHNRHLTLVFLGEVEAAAEERLRRAWATGPVFAPFLLPLLAIERFPDAQGLILAATAEATADLLALHRALQELLQRCEVVNPEAGRPLRPHITLARLKKSEGAPGAIPAARAFPSPLVLRVDRVHLYVSERVEGQRCYRPL